MHSPDPFGQAKSSNFTGAVIALVLLIMVMMVLVQVFLSSGP